MPMRGWGPIFQVPKSVLKRTTHLPSLYGNERISSHYIMLPTPYLEVPKMAGILNRLTESFLPM